jgi:hypothetical protein
MEEGVFLEADVHEGRLQAVFQIADFALEDAADEALLGGAFDGEFLEASLLDDGDAGFKGFGVDDDVLVGAGFGFDDALDPLDDLGDTRLDVLDESLGLRFGKGHHFKFLLLDLGRGVQMGIAELPSASRAPAAPAVVLVAPRLPGEGRRRRFLPARFPAHAVCARRAPRAVFHRRPLRGLLGPTGRVCCRNRPQGGNACRRGGACQNFYHS